jgi:NAD(P)-dependent dehydrogenase (short-subunit alcohol dehydrogenase family)
MFTKGLLKDKVAIITGGGTGIGKETAIQLGRLGCKVAICGRRLEVLKETALYFESIGMEVIYNTCDIRKYDSVIDFVKFVVEKFKTIDILINNAGGQFPSLAENISPNGFEAVIKNNLIGTWNMTHAVGTTVFLPEKKGCILNVVAQVKRGFPGMAHTGAARAGVINLTKTLAIEWAKHGITVNAIAPGVIESSGTKRYAEGTLDRGLKATPIGRIGTTLEVAQLMTYMVLPQASFITGQTFYIDGGQSLAGDIFSVSNPQINSKL